MGVSINNHCVEFHMVHDPETAKVTLSMTALTEDGTRVRYDAEGRYSGPDDEPRAEVSFEAATRDLPIDPYWRNTVSAGSYVEASCRLSSLKVEQMTRTIEPDISAEGGTSNV